MKRLNNLENFARELAKEEIWSVLQKKLIDLPLFSVLMALLESSDQKMPASRFRKLLEQHGAIQKDHRQKNEKCNTSKTADKRFKTYNKILLKLHSDSHITNRLEIIQDETSKSLSLKVAQHAFLSADRNKSIKFNFLNKFIIKKYNLNSYYKLLYNITLSEKYDFLFLTPMIIFLSLLIFSVIVFPKNVELASTQAPFKVTLFILVASSLLFYFSCLLINNIKMLIKNNEFK